MDRYAPATRLRIAVIGSGIAGLSCAWLLAQRHEVTIYEANDRLGGHCNTVDVPTARGAVAVDTGFIVYNECTYPNFTALLRHLGVATQPSDMSLGVSLHGGALEYASGHLLAQPRNLLRARFWAMLRGLRHLYRIAPDALAEVEASGETLGAWLDRAGIGAAVREDHLLPMAAAIWSCAPGAIADYPAAAFLRFCANHGLLQLRDRPQWRTITGGSRAYVARLAADFGGDIRLGAPVRALSRASNGVTLHVAGAEAEVFDHAVVATHAHQALALLAEPDAAERAALGAFGTTRNLAVLHSDPALMPRRRAAWSSWNYVGATNDRLPPFVSYWMNRLQRLRGAPPLFVTLNPPHPPRPGLLHASERYDHPVFGAATAQAQRALWDIQGVRRTWFCGAYFGAGFHEDGLQAGLAVADALGGARRPWRVLAESGRLALPAPAAPVVVR